MLNAFVKQITRNDEKYITEKLLGWCEHINTISPVNNCE